jgi:hypothetical protein
MAIREYGESLLRRQSAKRDERESQERKRQRRARKDELKLGAAVWLGKEALGMAKTAINRKTDNFLANSNLYDNTLREKRAVKTFDEQMAIIENAKSQQVDLPTYFNIQNSNKALVNQKLINPNSVAEGTEEEWKATWMEREAALEFAKEQAAFALNTQKNGRSIAAGNKGITLAEMGAQQRPTTVLGSLFNKVRGKEITSVETFNKRMALTKQVTATDSILDQQIELAQSFADKGNMFLAELTAPQVTSLLENEQKRIKELVANGNKVTFSDPVLQVVDKNLYQIVQEIITDGAGNQSYGKITKTLLHEASVNEVDGARIKQIKLNAEKTQTDMIKQSVDMVSELYSEAAHGEFSEFLSSQFNNTEDIADDDGTLYSSLMLAAATGKFEGTPWLKKGQRRVKLSSQEIAVIGSPYKTELDSLQSVRTSFLLVAEDTQKDEGARSAALTAANGIRTKMSILSGEFVQAVKDRETEVYSGVEKTEEPAQETQKTQEALGSLVVASQNQGQFFLSDSKQEFIKYNGPKKLEVGQEYFKIGDSLSILESVEDPETNTIIRFYMIGKDRHEYDERPVSGAGS